VFSIPCGMIAALAWPLLLRKPLPDRLDADALALVGMSVVLAAGATMMLGNPRRKRRLR
jgi:drug/metabolite transporter superfamily protein YnfA